MLQLETEKKKTITETRKKTFFSFSRYHSKAL